VLDPECGGGSIWTGDLAAHLIQQDDGSFVPGSTSTVRGTLTLTIRSAPGCPDAVGTSDVLQVAWDAVGLNLSSGGGLLYGSLTDLRAQQSGSITSGNYTGGQIFVDVRFPDGANGHLEMRVR